MADPGAGSLCRDGEGTGPGDDPKQGTWGNGGRMLHPGSRMCILMLWLLQQESQPLRTRSGGPMSCP